MWCGSLDGSQSSRCLRSRANSRSSKDKRKRLHLQSDFPEEQVRVGGAVFGGFISLRFVGTICTEPDILQCFLSPPSDNTSTPQRPCTNPSPLCLPQHLHWMSTLPDGLNMTRKLFEVERKSLALDTNSLDIGTSISVIDVQFD